MQEEPKKEVPHVHVDPDSEESDLEIDAEGVIEPDNDPPQEMGDESLEVRYSRRGGIIRVASNQCSYI